MSKYFRIVFTCLSYSSSVLQIGISGLSSVIAVNAFVAFVTDSVTFITWAFIGIENAYRHTTKANITAIKVAAKENIFVYFSVFLAHSRSMDCMHVIREGAVLSWQLFCRRILKLKQVS